MQEIIIGKHNGFCKGVLRAVKTAEEICTEGVYILGELIHNESVTEKLKNKGAVIVNGLSEIPQGKKVIIRSHGVSKSVYAKLEEMGCEIVDCTCPFVKRTQEIVANHLHDKSYSERQGRQDCHLRPLTLEEVQQQIVYTILQTRSECSYEHETDCRTIFLR